jgi:hypothetical protein
VQREFSTQRVLASLYRIDFVYRQIQFKGEAISCLTGSPHQFELGVAVSASANVELGIKIGATVNLSDPAETVGSVHNVAVSTVIQRGSGVYEISENQWLVGFILEAHDHIDDFVTARRTGAKVCDSSGKVRGFVAQGLAAAERALGRARSGRGGLRLGRCRQSKRTERQQDGHDTNNPRNRWN